MADIKKVYDDLIIINLYIYFSGQQEDSGVVSQLKKGILWQQRDKIFSRWKERFFVLTKDYLQCFKKGTSRITEMGGFIYGIRLTEVCTIYTKFSHIKTQVCFLFLETIHMLLMGASTNKRCPIFRTFYL